MVVPSQHCDSRRVEPPTSDPYLRPPALLRVRLDDDEDVEWQWTHFVDGRSVVTGYRIVKRDKLAAKLRR
jgi:hypothetical protein